MATTSGQTSSALSRRASDRRPHHLPPHLAQRPRWSPTNAISSSMHSSAAETSSAAASPGPRTVPGPTSTTTSVTAGPSKPPEQAGPACPRTIKRAAARGQRRWPDGTEQYALVGIGAHHQPSATHVAKPGQHGVEHRPRGATGTTGHDDMQTEILGVRQEVEERESADYRWRRPPGRSRRRRRRAPAPTTRSGSAIGAGSRPHPASAPAAGPRSAASCDTNAAADIAYPARWSDSMTPSIVRRKSTITS